MPKFRSEVLADLARQFSFAPPERRRAIIDHAEELYHQIDPERNYPLDFVIFRLTSYRPDTVADVTFIGLPLRNDLITLVDTLSSSMDESFDDYTPRPYTLGELADKLNVSTKTIQRYRTQGLFARRLRSLETNRKQLAFLQDSVSRFSKQSQGKLKEAAGFSRIDEATTHEITIRARRIVARRKDTPPMHIAEHLAKKYDRSTETIRALLMRHDLHDPRVAIFRDRTTPLSNEEQLDIYNAYRAGVSVRTLCDNYQRSRSVIYRAINLSRVAVLKQLDLRIIPNPTFNHPEADDIILYADSSDEHVSTAADEDKLGPDDSPMESVTDAGEVSTDSNIRLSDLYKLPPPDQAAEQDMFLRYNYLKYKASRIIQNLSTYHPASGEIDEAETFLRRATLAKHSIVNHYLRLIISVARQHVSATSEHRQNLGDLIAEGNLIILQAVDTFDVAKRNRFSTYLTYALMRRFAHTSGQEASQPKNETTISVPSEDQSGLMDSLAPVLPNSMNPPMGAQSETEQINSQIKRLFATLDEREHLIITRHFGLLGQDDIPNTPQTLAQIAEQLEITPERARQIEQRGLLKLRETAGDLGISFEDLSLLDQSF